MFTSLLPHNFFCFSGSHSSDCSHAAETIRQLLEENESLKNCVDELNHRNDELNQRVDELNQFNDELKQRVAALNHRVDELNQCNDALNRRNLELESTCRHYASATSSKKPK
ncbi:MAG: hypothetical protein LBG58_08475, partial [Planctomycetaceae bacterium]|nr:hypothetical protein [Planctomycetaceae bacterium]